jgi:N-acetyltransferase
VTRAPFTILEGPLVRLRPLEERDVEPLTAIALAHPHEYRLTSTPATPAQADAYFARAFREMAEGTSLVAAVEEQPTGRLLGSTRLTEIDPRHRRCELGYTWYRPDVFNSGVNVDCKRLMLAHAFDTLGLIRVQIHTDIRNVRSQRAIRALGARYEGVLRRHMITKDGEVRDTMVFAVTDEDWPHVRTRLEDRLARRLQAPTHA